MISLRSFSQSTTTRLLWNCVAASLLILAPACDKRAVPETPSRGEATDPAPAVTEAVATLQATYPGASVAYNEQGYVSELNSFVGPPPAAGDDPVRAAQSFVMSQRALFGLDASTDQLVAISADTALSARGDSVRSYFVRFQQHHGRRPVFDGYISVSMTGGKRVYAVYNDAWPLAETVGAMKITREDALERAQRAVKGREMHIPYSAAEEVVFPTSTSGIAAWQVDVAQWRVLIAGDDGRVLLIRSTSLHQDARVFRENPTRDSNNTSILPIANLANGATTLSGTRVTITNLAGNLQTSTNQQFRRNPDSINFDDQMVYFHMDNTFTFFNGFGFALPNAARTARTNSSAFECNAVFQSNNDSFAFGRASSGCNTNCQSAAHFADIIIHETTHRILFVNAGVQFQTDESGAIHEGTGDYFAASITGNNCLGDDFVEDRNCLRNAGTFRSFPRHMSSEAHDGSRIWASALVDIMELLGKPTADQIIAAGMQGLPANPTFAQFAGNIVVQGSAFFTNQLSDDAWKNFFILLQLAAVVEGVKEVFCSHGIATVYGSNVAQNIRTPDSGQTVDVTISVPAGRVVDASRGCRGGFDIIPTNGNSWEDLKTFQDRKDELEVFTETLSTTSLRVRMRAPGGCGGIPRVTIRYVLYHKQP